MRTAIIGLGAGGHAKGLIEIIRLSHSLPLAGLLDARRELWGKDILGLTILGGDSLLDSLIESEVGFFFVGVGSRGDSRPRQRLFDWAMARGIQPVQAIHPRAIVSTEARLSPGVQIFAGAIVNAGAQLDIHAIINSGAIVEHDCLIGPHAHVATGARLAGFVRVGAGAHIGIGATIREGISIGAGTIVGAGSVVVTDVPPMATVAGVPARPLRTEP
jgi:UDP-perosamine 4-acetyltransferase